MVSIQPETEESSIWLHKYLLCFLMSLIWVVFASLNFIAVWKNYKYEISYLDDYSIFIMTRTIASGSFTWTKSCSETFNSCSTERKQRGIIWLTFISTLRMLTENQHFISHGSIPHQYCTKSHSSNISDTFMVSSMETRSNQFFISLAKRFCSCHNLNYRVYWEEYFQTFYIFGKGS